ncbi:MAG TPA: M48 family metallopeptidase, partial [Chroococcidiopsis sp.]
MKAIWTIGLLVCGGSLSWAGPLVLPGWGLSVSAPQPDKEWRSPAERSETETALDPFAKTTVKGESAPSDSRVPNPPNPPSDPNAPNAPSDPGASRAPNGSSDPDFPDDVDTTPIPAEGGLVGQSEGDRQQLLIEGDRLWLQGQREQAELLYRKAKNLGQAAVVRDRPVPILDAAALPPAGQVYWREAEAGRDANLTTRMLVPLELLTRDYPQFVPGQLLYAELLSDRDRREDALAALERATMLLPDQPDLARLRINTLAANEQWLEASIAARQFALLHPDDAAAAEFSELAEVNLDDHRRHLRRRLAGNAIANGIIGTLGFIATGGLFGPVSTIQTTVLLLRGESAVGEHVAANLAERLPIVHDPQVVEYVNDIGQRLAAVSGRSEFNYAFYVVADDELNAFALPGGQVFINTGAIARTRSEAELAGLIAHELAHAVLSHGFEMVTRGTLTANVLQFIPYGGIATNLAVLSYSREMESQADALATRMLAASGYAADGLQNLMITLRDRQTDYPLEWLSTHPDTRDRVDAISTQIEL